VGAPEESLRVFLLSLRAGLRPGLVTFSQGLAEIQKNNSEQFEQTIELFRKDAELYSAMILYLQTTDKTDDPVCNLFFDWFGSGHKGLQSLVISFIPTLVEVYLTNLHSTKQTHLTSGIETVLLCMYGHKVRTSAGQPLNWNPPSLSTSSIYHNIDARSATKQTRRAVTIEDNRNGLNVNNEEDNPKGSVVVEGVLPIIGEHGIRTLERDIILREIIRLFVNNIGTQYNYTLDQYSSMVARICSAGFPFEEGTKNELYAQVIRIPLSSSILQCMAEGLHFCVFHQSVKLTAMWALDMIDKRATYDIHPNVIVTVRAIKRTSRAPSGIPVTAINTPRTATIGGETTNSSFLKVPTNPITQSQTQ